MKVIRYLLSTSIPNKLGVDLIDALLSGSSFVNGDKTKTVSKSSGYILPVSISVKSNLQFFKTNASADPTIPLSVYHMVSVCSSLCLTTAIKED